MPTRKHHTALVGNCSLRTVIDDHSRVANVEAHDHETKETTAAVLRSTVARFAGRGGTVHRVPPGNGG